MFALSPTHSQNPLQTNSHWEKSRFLRFGYGRHCDAGRLWVAARFHKWFHLTHCYRVGLGRCKVVARGVYWVFHTALSHCPYDILMYDIQFCWTNSILWAYLYTLRPCPHLTSFLKSKKSRAFYLLTPARCLFFAAVGDVHTFFSETAKRLF